TYGDFDDAVSVARPGVVDNGDGTWICFHTGDEIRDHYVTGVQTCAHRMYSSTTFHVSFTDVNPTVTAASAAVSAPEDMAATNSSSEERRVGTESGAGRGAVDNSESTWNW